MVGLIVNNLGLLWTYLLLTQMIAFQREYIPLAALIGYPFWSSLPFIISGTLSVLIERTRSKHLVNCTIVMNILSAIIATIGLILLSLELLLYKISSGTPIWPHVSGNMLSEYLFLFTFLELFLSVLVTSWAYEAKRT
ncbi:membrane-spanning 4-domains subfamily A member 12-like [Tupaia chinensis]|uniref:membrane-spanning 4-domains subfamily A member 12-like n=1 Tax=Tupaia chinensis TaxID=246437 RepID=UPI0003C903F0|nr:membrane-spanning 4-domains subfamily A member 12-like [Tupaia chinensis]